MQKKIVFLFLLSLASSGVWAQTNTIIILFVSGKDNLSKKIYLWAAKRYEAYYSDKSSPAGFHSMASVYAKGGDYQKAIALEEKAIEGAKAALEKGEMVGTIMDYTVDEYKEALAGYKTAAKTAKKS